MSEKADSQRLTMTVYVDEIADLERDKRRYKTALEAIQQAERGVEGSIAGMIAHRALSGEGG